MPSLSLLVTPAGHLRVDEAPPAPAPLDDAIAARMTDAFAAGEGAGLLHLGAAEVGAALPAVLGYFRDFGREFVARLCRLGEAGGALGAGEPRLEDGDVARWLLNLPPLRGAEYVDGERLRAWWDAIRAALIERTTTAGRSVEAYLREASPVWHLVGRVNFHLAENRRGAGLGGRARVETVARPPSEDEAADDGDLPDRPFAFLATYTNAVGARGRVQHTALGHALREYAGARNKEALLALLAPVHRAAEQLPWVKELVESSALYQPLAWTAGEALTFLRDTEALETAGVIVRVPEAWGRKRPARAGVQITVGGKAAEGLGAEALLDFDAAVTIDGERLTPDEIKRILSSNEGLVLLRGRWVEVDREGLARILDRFTEAQRFSAEGLPFVEALRLLAGAEVGDAAELLGNAPPEMLRVQAGPWLAEALEGLRSPAGVTGADPGDELKAELRPYQRAGVRWLWWLRRLGLGGCLADDMGLGKTVQVIALLTLVRREHVAAGNGHAREPARPSLVVAPASLIGNWRAEIERFAPHLRVFIAHASAVPAADLTAQTPETLAAHDVVLTSYGTLTRLPVLRATSWELAVADEAQAIKNAATKQARAVQALTARTRLALTGTPVENRLGDLWSIFAFSNPGLLGSAREFSAFVKSLEARTHDAYAPLRALVRPYILRRLKVQKEIIADLPDKTELKAFCALTRKQTALYQQSVETLGRELRNKEGIARRGLVLSYLMRLKQICNHPSHWLGDGAWAAADSGKLQRLGELCAEIAERQEKVLVFTQFKEVTEPLAAFLANAFGRPGLVLSGETAVGRRQKLVEQFQAEDGPPFFVLSLRAGGTGLTLTAASHVIHFDRWWNPAVEDQATDRAFRIGQKRNVLVHKLICRGTLEERIDAVIESKRALGRQIVEGGGEAALTELSDDEILRLVSLDVASALAEPS